MKKLMIILVALGLLMALPAAAGAKKPPAPPGQEPYPGETCAERTFDDPWYIGTADDDFTVTLYTNSDDLDSDLRAACIDVTSLEGVWEFDIDAVGVASFNMQIKDSVPGDMCWRDAWSKTKKTDLPEALSTPWVIPEATFNACPGDDFTDESESLVFAVGYSPERRAESSSLTIRVNLP